MAYNCHLSNYKNVYNTFLASRQILLSHDIYLSSITFPKIHLFNNLNSWYVFRNQKCELYQSSKYVNAIVASKQAVDKGGDPQEPHFFVMHTGVWNLVLDFGSGKGTYGPNLSEFLIHPTGGSYPIPPVNERWEAFPPDLVQTMHDLVSTNERRKVFQNILKSAGKDLSGESSFRLLSSSAKYWLPSKKLLSFLPEGISLEVDSDIIQNIYLPVGHKILGHYHDHDKSLTIFLAYASNSKLQEKQFYFISTCRLGDYLVADAVFLNSNTKDPFSDPIMFPMCSSSSIKEVVMVRHLLVQEFPPIIYYHPTYRWYQYLSNTNSLDSMEYQDMKTLQGEDNNYYLIYVSVSQSLISPIKLLLANFVIKGKKQRENVSHAYATHRYILVSIIPSDY